MKELSAAMRFQAHALFAAVALACSAGVGAQTSGNAGTVAPAAAATGNDVLKAAIEKAVNSNPDVTSRFNAYRASEHAVDVARGGFLPRVDLSADVGRDRDRITNRAPVDQSLNRNGAAVTVTQLLWDGLATANEVGRLGHERNSRYFDVLEASEQTAMEAARAYYDVLRYRRLVALAEDNYVSHRGAFTQIQSRVQAGVGRGVDLEQAGARQALAESNLNTELANLHDVSARYQRVVGEAPPRAMPLPTAFSSVPANALEASNEAVRRSPLVSASIETLRSARSAASSRNSLFQPRLEARVRSGSGKNFDGVATQERDTSAQIQLTWNLFNGGSDIARVRQQANLVNQAADLRDKACRDTRQTVAIAYNDTRKLTEQLLLLDRNTLAIEKARDAYRQQFDIGQRSLLDLLNSENELYTARRSYANAEYDLAVAYVRTQASLNRFSGLVGLTRGDDTPAPPSDVDSWDAGGDGPERCPALTVDVARADIAALNARAAATTPQMLANRPVVPSGQSPLGRTPPTAASAPTSAAPAPVATAQAQVERRVADWAGAWSSKNAERYLGFYDASFTPASGSAEQWQAARRLALGRPGDISVKIDGLRTRVIDADNAETMFQQTYASSGFNDVVTKTLSWRRVGGEWRIVKESGR